MNAKSLIFDIDGTLWDSRALVAKGYNQYFRANGLGHLQVTAEDLTKLFGKTMEQIADQILAEIPVPERYGKMLACMETEQQVMAADPCQIAYPGVVETLKVLAEGHRMFIVSNSERGYPDLLLDKLGVRDLFEGYLCYGDTRAPKGENIRVLMERYGITDAVYIGDTQGDLEACEYAGIPFVFCRYGFGQPERFDAAIGTFGDLVEMLK